MHGFSTARCSPGIPSASVPSCRARARTLVPRISAAKDVMCKDVVNIRRRSAASMEGQATIVFAGVEGQEIEVQCPKDTYILDAGVEAGLELPFTCRAGICGTCVGRVVEGQVDMSDIADISFTLEDEEVEQGLVLICMSRPVSNVVKIETQSDWGYSLGTSEWKGATGHIAGKEVQPLSKP
ncbi:Ferredoxin [Trebouxia sp. C0009 RCD-2024]